MTLPALVLDGGKLSLQVHPSTPEGAELIKALRQIVRESGAGGLDVVAILADLSAAFSVAAGSTEGQFRTIVAEVVAARERRGRGFGRPAEVRPS